MLRPLVRQLAATFGFAALVAIGWGIYNLMITGSCSTPPTPGVPPCPPGTALHVLAFAGGLTLAIPAVIVSGRQTLFSGIFASIGVAAVFAATAPDAEGAGRGWLYPFGLLFLAVGAIPLLLAPLAARSRRAAGNLMATGIEAVGTVLDLADTGVTINGNPRARVRMRIEPVGGYPAPFEGEQVVTVPRLEVPRRGDRYPVWLDPERPTERWTFSANVRSGQHGVRRLVDVLREAGSPTVPPPSGGVVEELARLNEQRLAGAISDRDFAERTAGLLQQLQLQQPGRP